jgi:hypothetical protein
MERQRFDQNARYQNELIQNMQANRVREQAQAEQNQRLAIQQHRDTYLRGVQSGELQPVAPAESYEGVQIPSGDMLRAKGNFNTDPLTGQSYRFSSQEELRKLRAAQAQQVEDEAQGHIDTAFGNGEINPDQYKALTAQNRLFGPSRLSLPVDPTSKYSPTEQLEAAFLNERDPAKQRAILGRIHQLKSAEHISSTGDGGAAGVGVIPPSVGGLHGPEFLKTLSDADAAEVRALSEGRLSFPAGFAMKAPYWQQKLAQVAQFDPSFDATNFNARAKSRQDFTSGKTAQAIKAGNTMIQHLEEVSRAGDALNNFGSVGTPLNAPVNWAERALLGDPRVTNFNNAVGRYSEEATKFYRGAGGSESDIKREMANLNPDMSPSQLHGAKQTQLNLLRGGISAYQTQWRNAMGPYTPDFDIISPESQAAIGRMTGSGSPGHAVGDVVNVGGRSVRITAIHPDGTFDGEDQ